MSWSCRSLHLVSLVVALTLAACHPEEDQDREPIEGGPETCLTKALECGPFASCKYGADQKPYCECNPGFEGDGVTCLEVDECEDPSPCSPNATCLRVENATDVCICNEGFVDEPTGDDYRWGTNCVDINECGSELLNNCDRRAVCHNTPGSYECACNGDLGYTEDEDPLTPPGTVCVDLDECALNLHNCDPKATCTNTEGGFTCACDPSTGYAEDADPATPPGTVCVDIDECVEGTHDCGAHARCTNTVGSFTCACDAGWTTAPGSPEGRSCVNVDECAAGTHACDPDATCDDTDGDYTCTCNAWFVARNAPGDDPNRPVCVPSAPLGAGNGNGCLIRPEDGSVWCWGYDTAGAVDLGTPRRMGGDTGFVQLSQDGTCGFKRDGSLWCWTTGISTTDGGPIVDWRRIGLAGGWRKPVRGWATRAPGTLWRWDATAAVPGVPEMYGTETDWLDFCPGTALTGETVYCGIKVGPPTSTVCWSDAPAADRIQVGTGFVSLSCQGSRTCGVKEDGSAACWTPVLVPPSSPDGDYVLTAQPYAVRAGFDIAHALVVDDLVEITVGGDFVCAIREDGGLYCAGRFGTSLPMVGDLLPDSEPWLVRLGNDPGWRSVVGGADHACAIRDNRVYCWGANGLGQLGGLAPADTLVPTEVIFPAMLP